MAKKAVKKTIKKKTIKKKTVKKSPAKKNAKKSSAVKKSAVKKASPKALKVAMSEGAMGLNISDLKLPMNGGKEFNLKDLNGKKVVLYFYPKDMTPGCTIEGHDFSKLKADFAKHNTLVFGISRDSVASHEKFIAKEGYSVDLLSDEKESACKLFDVIKEKNMYGKKVMGIERSTFVLNEQGVVVGEWRKVKVEGHAKEVLDFVTGL
jgi:peroxiredoxin Q/BCP